MHKDEKKILVQYTNELGQTITAKVTNEHLVRLAQQFTIYILK